MDIRITISDMDQTILNNDLVDIEEWVQGAVDGKINNCRQRMVAEWQSRLFADSSVLNIPADDAGLINLVVARSDYKNRAKRMEIN